MILIDLSDCFDYVLHRLTGCPVSTVRAMPDYHRISKGILNLNNDVLASVTVENLIAIDDSVYKWIVNLFTEINCIENLTNFEKVELLVRKMNRLFITEAMKVRNYIAMFIRHKYEKVIIRSKSLSGIVATTDENIDTECELYDPTKDIEPYILNLRILEHFEIAKRGDLSVLSRSY